QRLAMIEDDKLVFRLDALDAQLQALRARMDTARSELSRGERLIERGVITSRRLEELQTTVDVISGEISTTEAERLTVERQIEEGAVLAPESGIVLTVPVSRGSVVTPGEALAEIGGGGFFLRLAVPERHAGDLAEGDTIEIGGGDRPRAGRLVKLYPQISGGRVEADVEVDGLDERFVGRRVPVRLPVGTREAVLVPAAALTREGGLDFVTVEGPEGPVRRVVVPGPALDHDGEDWREILTGLEPGETVVTADE
ncbi:MAG: efflux RND transporter periplasmic adaptor subunit, partial [Paracoccaceae bacterium]